MNKCVTLGFLTLAYIHSVQNNKKNYYYATLLTVTLLSKARISMYMNSNNRTQPAAGRVGSGELWPACFEALR